MIKGGTRLSRRTNIPLPFSTVTIELQRRLGAVRPHTDLAALSPVLQKVQIVYNEEQGKQNRFIMAKKLGIGIGN